MSRLHYVNLAGVLALAALCLVQWQRDRKLNLEVNRLEKTRLDQAGKIAEHEQAILALTVDLTQFKEQLGLKQTELEGTQKKLASGERDVRQLTVERDQLKTSVTNWAAAVASRNEQLKEAQTQIRKLAEDLNTSIRKFNDLATNYNAVVKELNEMRARPPQPQSPPQPAPAKSP